ncbi:hypothetical protein ALP29_00223 [Pseudomonas syringae pv. avii]|uniref:Uncharacterized protein n=1 Tax=Pseudomonas syringae pv. avii TaxID=663959 RepID=A0A3M5VHQ8_PSESX|nr:hypothetical protein [Pseudomonas azotoformans]RMT61663.1 hypothetical protein ALP43_03215 [Pseudomonas azotoformans]RMU57749.1 hypothetical protein ALP29_00223 [Pseudomonas syringae pv. avii]
MKLTSYIYKGPQSAVCLRVGKPIQLLDVQLIPGKPVELPADHDYTKTLVALKHLTVMPLDPSKAAPKSAPVSAKASVGTKGDQPE